MLPIQSRPTHNRQQTPYTAAGSRPLHALRQLQMHNRAPSRQCATPSKAVELTPQEQQLLQYALNYEYKVNLPEGELVISPLREKWLQRTGDLLADTFVDAKGIQPYRRYVRRNIGKYLDQHINMPPAAVLVTAVLRTQVEASPSNQLDLHDLQQSPLPGPHSAANDDSSSTSSACEASTSSSTQLQGEGSREPKPVENALGQLLLKCFGWLVVPNDGQAAVGGSSSSSSSSAKAGLDAAASSNTAAADASDHSSSSSSSSSPSSADAVAAVRLFNTSSSDARGASTQGTSGSTSSSSSSNSTSMPGLMGTAAAALQRLSDSVSLHGLRRDKGSQMHVVETLVGVAEVSFRERTRSQAITLNPPQKCAYLCNMAVSKQWQRRGIASQLMVAVEDLCLLAGEPDLYLHLRFKDAATAGSLYRKAGFTQAKKDCWLLLLLGQEPRYLMLKQLAAERALAGQVLLPGFRQGVSAAELLQQQQQQQQQQEEGIEQPEGQQQAAAGQQPAAAPAASPAG